MAAQPLSEDLLSPTVIAEAGLRILDARGPEALSFRSLGKAIGVSHMTVHRRCGDGDGLLDLLADHLAQRLPDFDHDAPWAEATVQQFTALYELMCAHPALVTLRAGRPWLGEAMLARMVEPCLAANVRTGMSHAEAVAAYRRMYLFTLGAASLVDHRAGAAARERTAAVLAGLDPARFPVLTAASDTVVGAVTDHEVYTVGLHQLVDAARTSRAR